MPDTKPLIVRLNDLLFAESADGTMGLEELQSALGNLLAFYVKTTLAPEERKEWLEGFTATLRAKLGLVQ